MVGVSWVYYRRTNIKSMIDPTKRYLVTGGAGFLGRELVGELISRGITRLLIMSRNEGQLIALKETYPQVDILPGDISDSFLCDKACAQVDGIFHLAAMKHVGLAEEHVTECVKSNIMGTMNLLEGTRKYKHDFIIGISTDKAAKVNGVYGATKFIAEKLFVEYEKMNPATKYRTVRYGNVLYSTGSVLCKWKDRLRAGLPITATDANSTRFYWSVEDAVDLIFDCVDKSTDATPHITRMRSIRLGDLLDAMITKYAKGDVEVNWIGLQPGENMHEVVADGLPSSADAERYTKEEILNLV